MKKLFALLTLLISFVLIAGISVHASDITTTAPVTTEPATTTEQTTTESTTTAETTTAGTTTGTVTTQATTPGNETNPFDFTIGDDGTLYINGQAVSKAELVNMLTMYLNEQFGEYLGPLAWILGIIAAIAVTFAILLLKKIGGLISEYRKLNTTNQQAITVRENVDRNVVATRKAEARAVKAEAMNALLMDAIYKQMANSKNPTIVASAVKFKEEADRVLAMDDNIPDMLQVVEAAGKSIAETAVGETIKKAKEYTKNLVDQITNEDKPKEE